MLGGGAFIILLEVGVAVSATQVSLLCMQRHSSLQSKGIPKSNPNILRNPYLLL